MMRSTFILPAVALVVILGLSLANPLQSMAQGIYVGGGYSTHVEDPGISGGVYFPVAGVIQVGGDFTYYLVSDTGDLSWSIWTVDFNGRYPVLPSTNGGPAVYAIAGVNVLRYSFDAPSSPGFDFGDASGTDIGLNAGGVVEYMLGSIGVFAKAHAVGIGGDSNGFVFGGGIFKTIGG